MEHAEFERLEAHVEYNDKRLDQMEDNQKEMMNQIRDLSKTVQRGIGAVLAINAILGIIAIFHK